MTDSEGEMREIAGKLLREKNADLIIGYERGTLPLRSTPCFVSDPEDTDRLIWDVTCEANLAKHLIGREGRIGVVAKGCDARSIVACAIEHQLDTDDLFIIGTPCSGVIDRAKIEKTLGGKEALEVQMDGAHLRLKGEGFERTFAVREVLDDSCVSCRHRNPPIYDVLVGEKVQEAIEEDAFPAATELEAQAREERWGHFTKALGTCIRCYACRNVCPMCYCEECFVDQNMPTWLGKTDELSDTMAYHIIRALHMAGRCVNCGACSRACPMGINLRELTQEMARLVTKMYGFETGLSTDTVPPLSTFKQDDPQEFIK